MNGKAFGMAISVAFALTAFAQGSLGAPNLTLKLTAKSTLPMTPAPSEAEFIRRINMERTSRGLSALTLDPVLMETARDHSRDMAERDYFSHRSPAPAAKTPLLRYVKDLESCGGERAQTILVGENIYYCSVFTKDFNVRYGHKALMESPGHRANILEPRYQKVGVGVYIDPIGQFYVTEMFLRDTPAVSQVARL